MKKVLIGKNREEIPKGGLSNEKNQLKARARIFAQKHSRFKQKVAYGEILIIVRSNYLYTAKLAGENRQDCSGH